METTYLVGPAYASPLEARVTAPDGEPGQGSRAGALGYAYWQLGYSDVWADQYLGDDTALTYSVVWACVSYIAQTVASLGWHVYERQEDRRIRLQIEDNIAWTLGVQANPETDAFNWRQKVLKDALLGGNGYAEIERTGAGKPYWLWQIDRRRVCPDRTAAGQLVYEVENGSGVRNTVLLPQDIFHLKGLGDDGLVGYGVVELARRSIRLGLTEEQFADSAFKKGPMPGGILEIPGNLTAEARETLRKDVQRLYGGGKNAGNVLVLTGGQKWTKADFSHEDAQFLESRTFQADEIARWFRVPPHKVGLLARSTFSNIEHQAIEAVQDCLLPWCRRLESEADVKLFGRVQMGRRYTRLNLGTLLRGDSQTQTSTVTAKVTNGIMTVNEGRAHFDLNPVDGGDTPLIQGAMVPLERVLEEPEPEPAPAPPPEPPAEGEPPPEEEEGGGTPPSPEDLARAFLPLLEAEIARLLRFEEDQAARAHSKGKLGGHVERFYDDDAARHEKAALLPVFLGLVRLLGRPDEEAEAWATQAAAEHARGSVEALRGHGIRATERWKDRPRAQAEKWIKEILHVSRNGHQ